MAEALDLIMFAVACLFLISGFPVAFTLAGVALVFGLVGHWVGVFDTSFFFALPQRIFGTMTNEVLIAVPLFVFMGTMLERARIAEDLLENMSLLFGRVRGGLGISVSIVGALLAASTGIVGATVVTMGLLSLPTMLKRGYDPALASGSIAAAGTLGQIIPPSIVLVLLGDVIANAYQKAQLEQGIFSPETVSVGELFAGSLLPGLVLVGFYIAYQLFVAYTQPEKSPPADMSRSVALPALLRALLPPILLIIAVLGSILGGIATPTEAASVGAVGTILLAGEKLANGHRLMRLGALALIGLVVLTGYMDLRLNRDQIS
ncbi:MAG: TRAP transporter large permease subunit, partial [Alphaproteobacteria bacterium]|nr:TRAP transporter large permease subunit [Alphaproteobacteria bacterium]